MKNSLKGALFSGLVYPGLGQIIVKRYKRGVILIALFTASVAAFIVKAVQQALAIIGKIQSGGDALTMNVITDAATKVTTASDSLTLKLLMAAILVLWVIGIADAYRTGREKDRETGNGYE